MVYQLVNVKILKKLLDLRTGYYIDQLEKLSTDRERRVFMGICRNLALGPGDRSHKSNLSFVLSR